MSVVTMGATLSNPAMLNEQELRAALERANSELLAKDLEIHQLHIVIASNGNVIANLCELYLAKRFGDFTNEVERITEIYSKMKAAIAARKVH